MGLTACQGGSAGSDTPVPGPTPTPSPIPGPTPNPTPDPGPTPTPPPIPPTPVPPTPAVPDNTFEVDGISYTNITDAQNALKDNSTLVIGNGTYRQGMTIKPSNVTIQGSTNTHFVGGAVSGKATFVIQGNDTTMEQIECSGVTVPDQNGACIRQEGKNLLLKSSYFHDSEQGILANDGSGIIRIEYSRFNNLGKAGRAHAIYVNKADRLEVRYSKFYSSKDEGHEIKSRAKETIIEYSEIASLTGNDSRLVDVPNAGKLVIRASVLEQGPNSANNQLIGYGYEVNPVDPAISHSVEISDNIIILERNGGNHFFGISDSAKGVSKVVTQNKFVGQMNDSALYQSGNQFYADRAAFGLGPFPELPSIGI
ncbi:right-handed parallel beta-helix repeat-containing protein [Photobacterium kagoshimensis]